MGRPTREAQQRYMQEYRSRPLAAAVIRWRARTYASALQQLARKHPAEFLRILDRIRAEDPRPGTEAATKKGQTCAA
jgi:hypothetical protein